MLANAAETRDEYLRLREVQIGLNKKLLRTTSKKGFEHSARDLDLWAGGKIVLEHEGQMDLVSDYALYEYQAGGRNAVERCLARRDAPEGSDEHVVLQAMVKARFTLVEIQEVVPDVGVHAVDRLYGEPLLLADVGLSKTGAPGIVMATRLLPFSRFTMTSGAPVQVDPKVAALFVEGLREAIGPSANVGLLPPKLRKQLARNILVLALSDPDDVKATWQEKVATAR